MAARQDALEYATFIRDKHKSPEAARRWLDGLFAAIKGLAETPDCLPVIPEADELGFPYRSLHYHSHRVVYAVHEREQLVTIHRIYHSARKPLADENIP